MRKNFRSFYIIKETPRTKKITPNLLTKQNLLPDINPEVDDRSKISGKNVLYKPKHTRHSKTDIFSSPCSEFKLAYNLLFIIYLYYVVNYVDRMHTLYIIFVYK